MSDKNPLSQLPDRLQSVAEKPWSQLESHPSLQGQSGAQLSQELCRVLAISDFVADQLTRRPEWLESLVDEGDITTSYPPGRYAEKLVARLTEVDDEALMHQQLRRFRNYEMVRLIWRDLTRRADMRETTRDLSHLADACIDETLTWLYQRATKRWGMPLSGSDAQPQQLVVLGMGKLGANELNLSSDIDLMFCFPANGETDHPTQSLENQDFFIRLGQKLIQALDNQNAEGFVFRVDMRLRPFGTAGPLAVSFTAMEHYYQDQGRDWERYAMIKARPVAGDIAAGEQLMQQLRPFVYRKYIDFSAFESLRDMKLMINREVRRKGLEQNVKLGSGGIREVEFIAQAFQLIRGGRDLALQQRELLNILPLLPEHVGMPESAVQELVAAYVFLRNTEHAIQSIADKQTQELPDDPQGQARIALAMGFADWDSFQQQLAQHRRAVSQHFADVIAPAEAEGEQNEAADESEWKALINDEMDQDQVLSFLSRKGFADADSALKQLQSLRQSRAMQMLQQVAKTRLLHIMPALLETVGQCRNAEVTLERVLLLIQAVLRRSAYLVLLAENPGAMQQLVRLCSSSAWFAAQLSKQPVLLDELIDPRTLFTPPDKARLQAELSQQLLRVPEDDMEQLMETLRYFHHAHVLRVAASDITEALPLMKVSDYLTWLAETLLEAVLQSAWRMLTEKHGVPMREPGEPCDPDFVVVGYGKMGGIELSYGSDLDLVFIHDADPDLNTNGDKSVPNPVFFNRLGQKMIHFLNTFTPSGQLYDIDMRLRPSGNSGLLVSGLKAFKQYQQKEAWTWEHQALVRARVVAGSPALAKRFEQVRSELLSQPRDRAVLLEQVCSMREKMREHLGSRTTDASGSFDLKQDRGGIVDIEFMVQFMVLNHANKYPDLLTYTDNIRILDGIEANGLMTAEQAGLLRDAYRVLRSVGHRQALQEQSSSVVADEELSQYRQQVARIWDEVMC
ncbi:bifunctional [glutamate--ammonia ligase]-adenylyl-L-tyrosine phosphorylase/[glutamate--ammonia-ligase] adenylyltransferase [Nitrincola iocasae]|uniref:Bifunctional glutamine synthetase adenylyltransferase/adenylyl-removing enzyme n=1 Tax=Nitrincola iocasae TaxID=2614693 RepID=A0A5J6LIA4_9GAMM|nr:bifunctional [glutamate--ammonia ligase]-adenylyl-L-tyrosine phosphorylase/[glutamate--ammonia-ligase] adenylyltransferase [Nitrincola iocasae]QEW08103.1 bifunctional [glutamate--ammonia ligase]-adenylyl-L-tyrosine phosphorylase/[glutamate--ammonia-ligase] adenylyltransferase [Nitrincola iocasae]